MEQLSKLRSSGKKRKRVGRGGSRGGTSGKGHKGQRARTSGNARIGFEGGQMPLVRRLPKRGFNNSMFSGQHEIIGLDQLEARFNDGDQVTLDILISKGVFISATRSFKVLGGELTKKLDVHAHAFSKSAQEKITKVGGSLTVVIRESRHVDHQGKKSSVEK